MLGTASLTIAGVTLWTVRVAVTARGSRLLGAGLAATEAILFALVFSQLMAGFDSLRIIAYGAGVATGTLLGLTLDRRLTPKLSRVEVVDTSGGLSEVLTRSGWPHTRSDGVGTTGHVSVVSVAPGPPSPVAPG